jgi:uncharacterized membrane protein HdeD (DUF308 family)
LVSGSVGILVVIALLQETQSGFWPLAVGIVSVFLGLLAGRIERVQSETFRAIIAVGFLALALLLLRSAINEIASDEPGAATFSLIGALAALSVSVGWVVGVIAEDRLKAGKAGPISRWAARVWRPRNARRE